MSPTNTWSAGSMLVRGLEARTRTRTGNPSRRNTDATAAPTKPLAPVTSTGPWACEPGRASGVIWNLILEMRSGRHHKRRGLYCYGAGFPSAKSSKIRAVERNKPNDVKQVPQILGANRRSRNGHKRVKYAR